MAATSSPRSKKVSSISKSTPRPSSSWACSLKNWLCSTVSNRSTSPSGPIEPAMKTSSPETSRASRASRTAVELICSSSSSRKWPASLRRLAPNVFVSISSAPARMKLACSATTLSGARRLASSGQRSRGTAPESSAPMPPSATIGGPVRRRSSKRLDMAASLGEARAVNPDRGTSQPPKGDSSKRPSTAYSGHLLCAPMWRARHRRKTGFHPPSYGSQIGGAPGGGAPLFLVAQSGSGSASADPEPRQTAFSAQEHGQSPRSREDPKGPLRGRVPSRRCREILV